MPTNNASFIPSKRIRHYFYPMPKTNALFVQ